MHVVDVGANIGLYSLLFWRLAGPEGRVYAVEPDALMASALRDNLARNGASASVFACAAGASLGRAALHRNAVNSGDNRLGRLSALVQAGEVMVPVRPLSELIPEDRVDFVKIDVQGWEAEVLSGMSGLIDRNPHVRIYFEFWPQGLQAAGASAERLACVLRDLGLEVRQPRSGGRMVAVDIEALTRTLRPQAYVNLVASREG